MPNNVRLGGAYFTFTADARGYEAGANRAIAANSRLAASYGRFAVQLNGTQVLAQQFATSLRSSLLATTAYAAGVGLVSATLRNVVGGFLEYDRGLIRISKTTDISGEALERLGQRIEALGTGPSGLRPALPVLREELFAIAEAAGQAGVTTSRGIETITRAAGELQVSSNLIGSDAVRSLTRYLQVTGQTLDRTDAIASAYTHLGNNIVGTEAEIASFATRVAQNLSAVGRATDEFILGVSATLVELDVQQEAAGSALQRTQIALLRLAGDPTRFRGLAEEIGGTADEVEALRRRFVEGTASAEDFDRVFLAFLQRVRQTRPTERQSFIASIIGGGEANVRNTRVIGVLAQRLDRVRRNQDLAAEATEQANFHTREAARAAEAQSSALRIVLNQLEEQSTAVGRVVTPSLIFLAENFRVLEVAAAAAVAAFASRGVVRRVEAYRAGQAQLAQASNDARAALARQRAEINRQDQALRRQATARRTYIASFERERVLRGELTTATRRQAAAERRLGAARAARARAQAVRGQVGGVYAALGASAIDPNGDIRRQYRTAQRAVQRANQAVARQAASLAAIETQRQATGIRNNREYRRALAAEQRAQQTLNRARAQAADLQRQVNRQVRLGTRIARAASSTLAFLGGPIGLITTALTVGATAWLLWGNRASEAEERLQSLRDEVQQFVDAADAAGLTAAGNLVRRLEEEIARQEAILEGLRTEIDAAPVLLDDTVDFTPQLRQFQETSALIRQLREDLAALRAAMGEAGEDAEDMGFAAQQSFTALPISILPAIQAVEEFRASLEGAARADLVGARAEERAARLLGNAAREELAIADARARIVAFQLNLERRLENARRSAAEADLRVDILRTERDALAIGSEAREEAERALTTEEKRRDTLRDQVTLLAEQLRLAGNLSAPEDVIRETVRRERAAQVRRTLTEPAQRGQPDDAAVVREARETFEIQRRIAEVERQSAAASAARAASSAREESAIRASLAVTQEYEASLLASRDALALNAIELRAVTQARAQQQAAIEKALSLGLEVTDEEERRFVALRDQQQALQDERTNLEANAEALRDAAFGYQALADAQANLARASTRGPLDDLVDQAGRLSDRLEEVAARGFNSLTDSLVDLVTTGKASFKDLANSIIADLLRVLIQAQITAPIVQALTGVLPFLFGGASGGAPFPGLPGFTGGHTGGVAPFLPQRLHRPTGLRSDELFAVLQRGEVVVPRALAQRMQRGSPFDMAALRQWMQSLPRLHSGGVAGGGGAFGGAGGGGMRIELVNQSSTQLEAVDNGTRIDGADYVRSVILRDARSQGPITRTLGRVLRGGT